MFLQHSQNHVMSLGGIWCDSVECGSPNKGETGVHGCHCRGDMLVRMRKVLAIPRSSYVCFGALTGIKPMYPILFSLLWDSSVRDGQLEKLWRGGGGRGWQIHQPQERAYSGIPSRRLQIRSRNEAINSTRNMIYSLKVFYFLPYRGRYFLFLNWFSTRVSEDQKYLCGSRL